MLSSYAPKAHASVRSCCACSLAVREASQRVLYESLRRHGNRTQLGLERGKNDHACTVDSNVATGEHTSPHMGSDALTCRAFNHRCCTEGWHTCRVDEGETYAENISVSAALSLHGGLSDMNEGFLLSSRSYAALQVSVRLESSKASLILKIEPTSRQWAQLCLRAGCGWGRKAPPAVRREIERKICKKTGTGKN